MPTTEPKFGWPVPEDADELAEGAAAMRSLAGAIASDVAKVATLLSTTPASGTLAWDYSAAGFTSAPVVIVGQRSNAMPGAVIAVAAGNATATGCDIFTRSTTGPGSAAIFAIAVERIL